MCIGTRTTYDGTTYDGFTGPFSAINGAGVNPVDNKAYASVKNLEGNSPDYLVRFDSNTVHLLTKMPLWSYSACVDSAGDYLWVAMSQTYTGANGPIKAPLYKIANVGSLVGYSTVADLQGAGMDITTNSVIVDTSHAGKSANQAGLSDYQDITAVHADLTNSGTKQRYVVGMHKNGRVSMLRYSGILLFCRFYCYFTVIIQGPPRYISPNLSETAWRLGLTLDRSLAPAGPLQHRHQLGRLFSVLEMTGRASMRSCLVLSILQQKQ